MISKIISGVLLAACGSLVQAATEQQWAFEWQGFSRYNGSYFDPNKRVTGTFAGVDANDDDILSLNELTGMTINGYKFLNCTGSDTTCSINAFSYSEAAGLQFTASYQSSYYSPIMGSHVIWSTDYIAHQHIEDWSFGVFGEFTERMLFTPQTTETITRISAVPEPAGYAMLGIGVLLVAAGAKRRRAAHRAAVA